MDEPSYFCIARKDNCDKLRIEYKDLLLQANKKLDEILEQTTNARLKIQSIEAQVRWQWIALSVVFTALLLAFLEHLF